MAQQRKDVAAYWEKISKAESKSLLKKHLTNDLYSSLKEKKTSFGGTLCECIMSG